MAKLKIRKGDHVVVITGKDKGKKGEVLKVMPAENRAIVKGVAMVRRHQRQTADARRRHHLQGSRRSIFPISRSRIPRTGSPTRVGYKFLKDGRKVRFAKRSGEVIDG